MSPSDRSGSVLLTGRESALLTGPGSARGPCPVRLLPWRGAPAASGTARRKAESPHPGVITESFRFSFTGPSPVSVLRARQAPVELLADLDDYAYLAVRACGALGETDES